MLYKTFTKCKNLSMYLFFCFSRCSIELSILIRLSVHFVCPMRFVIRLIGQGFASLFGIRDPSQSLWMRIDKRAETAKKKKFLFISSPNAHPTHFLPPKPDSHHCDIRCLFVYLTTLPPCTGNTASNVVITLKYFEGTHRDYFCVVVRVFEWGSWRNPQKHKIRTVVLHAENRSRHFRNMWVSEISARNLSRLYVVLNVLNPSGK